MIILLKSILFTIMSGCLIYCATVFGQINSEVNDRPAPYLLDETFFKLPDDRPIGNTAGLAIDTDGDSIWAYDACAGTTCAGSDVDPILKFDANGVLVQSFGAGLILRPHTIHIDPEGNVWVTDREGPDGQDASRDGKGHQVLKFSRDGELLMTLGTAGVADAKVLVLLVVVVVGKLVPIPGRPGFPQIQYSLALMKVRELEAFAGVWIYRVHSLLVIAVILGHRIRSFQVE